MDVNKTAGRDELAIYITSRKRSTRLRLRFPGVPPNHATMQLPIQTGASAPTAAVGDGFGSICGPLIA